MRGTWFLVTVLFFLIFTILLKPKQHHDSEIQIEIESTNFDDNHVQSDTIFVISTDSLKKYKHYKFIIKGVNNE
jgi:hypothetical protein